MGVSAVKWGSVILEALARPRVAVTSKVKAGDTNVLDSPPDVVDMWLMYFRDPGGEDVSSLRQAPPPPHVT